MEYETLFLIGSALLLGFDLLMLVTASGSKKQRAQIGFYAAAFSFGLIFISYLTLLKAFISMHAKSVCL
jgi:hypothetical protein